MVFEDLLKEVVIYFWHNREKNVDGLILVLLGHHGQLMFDVMKLRRDVLEWLESCLSRGKQILHTQHVTQVE